MVKFFFFSFHFSKKFCFDRCHVQNYRTSFLFVTRKYSKWPKYVVSWSNWRNSQSSQYRTSKYLNFPLFVWIPAIDIWQNFQFCHNHWVYLQSFHARFIFESNRVNFVIVREENIIHKANIQAFLGVLSNAFKDSSAKSVTICQQFASMYSTLNWHFLALFGFLWVDSNSL